MKVLSESPRQRSGAKVSKPGIEKHLKVSKPAMEKHLKVSKPAMEKRRRERIKSSLETLRLLMVENSQNEKLKNPKVERAEILESVVDFLKTEKEMGHQDMMMIRRGALPAEQRAPCGPQHSYQGGMRACLLRVSQFITTKTQELESPEPVHESPLPAPPPAAAPPQLTSSSSSSSPRLSAPHTDPVWRPWPV